MADPAGRGRHQVARERGERDQRPVAGDHRAAGVAVARPPGAADADLADRSGGHPAQIHLGRGGPPVGGTGSHQHHRAVRGHRRRVHRNGSGRVDLQHPAGAAVPKVGVRPRPGAGHQVGGVREEGDPTAVARDRRRERLVVRLDPCCGAADQADLTPARQPGRLGGLPRQPAEQPADDDAQRGPGTEQPTPDPVKHDRRHVRDPCRRWRSERGSVQQGGTYPTDRASGRHTHNTHREEPAGHLRLTVRTKPTCDYLEPSRCPPPPPAL